LPSMPSTLASLGRDCHRGSRGLTRSADRAKGEQRTSVVHPSPQPATVRRCGVRGSSAIPPPPATSKLVVLHSYAPRAASGTEAPAISAMVAAARSAGGELVGWRGRQPVCSERKRDPGGSVQRDRSTRGDTVRIHSRSPRCRISTGQRRPKSVPLVAGSL